MNRQKCGQELIWLRWMCRCFVYVSTENYTVHVVAYVCVFVWNVKGANCRSKAFQFHKTTVQKRTPRAFRMKSDFLFRLWLSLFSVYIYYLHSLTFYETMLYGGQTRAVEQCRTFDARSIDKWYLLFELTVWTERQDLCSFAIWWWRKIATNQFNYQLIDGNEPVLFHSISFVLWFSSQLQCAQSLDVIIIPLTEIHYALAQNERRKSLHFQSLSYYILTE